MQQKKGMDAEEKHYYSLLGVTKQVTDEDLKKAYRNVAKKYHSDRNPGNEECVIKFKEGTEAYNMLLEIRKRKNEKFSIKNIFNSVNNVKSSKSTVYAGAAKEKEKSEKKLSPRGEDMSTTLELKLPKNIVNGQSIKIAGKGNVGEFGADPGDIIIDIQVEDSKKFISKGLDMYYRAAIIQLCWKYFRIFALRNITEYDIIFI